MARRSAPGQGRAQGSIETLPSGALRVRVYAGIDPVTGRRHYLSEQINAGPKAAKEAEATRNRLLHQVAEKRNPRTSATIDQLLDRYLGQFDGAPNTLTLYRGYVRNHISPFLGRLTVGSLDADVLDSFYAELRRCRTHCNGRRPDHHRVTGPHECDRRCGGQHVCRPLSPTTVRHMHFILSGAYKRAVRWRLVSVSPIAQALPPGAPKPNPQPPTPSQAARIVNEAWRDPDWGALVWVAMTTGARRGELCAIRWSSVDLEEDRESIWLRHAVRKDGNRLVEAELKTHQQRRIALDTETVLVLRDCRDRSLARARALGLELAPDAFVFSGAVDALTFLQPDSVTQRYDRLAERLGIATTFHKLRHYSATELIAAGVDIRTVAGRLGHGGGGTTTLRAYTAWVSEADQRAASGIPMRMPLRPAELDQIERARVEPRFPNEVIAATIADRIAEGTLLAGSFLPSSADVAVEHGVSLATAKRTLVLVREWGLVVRVGRNRLRVTDGVDALPAVAPPPARATAAPHGDVLLDFVIRHRGVVMARFSSVARPDSPAELQQVLVDAVDRFGGDIGRLTEYEMDLRRAGKDDLIATFVGSRHRPS